MDINWIEEQKQRRKQILKDQILAKYIREVKLNTPLKHQLVFDPEKTIKLESDDPNYVHPVCIRCQCLIFQSMWSPKVEQLRRSQIVEPLTITIVKDMSRA